MYAMDVRPLQALTADIVQNNAVHVIPPEPARSPAGGFGRGGGFGGSAPGATVHYWLRSAGPVTIEVKDTAGQVVASLNGSGDAGLNRTTWNLSRAGTATPAGGGRGGRGGAFVSPAVFAVEVRQGNNVSSGFIQVSR
jgi:hypothetical protein